MSMRAVLCGMLCTSLALGPAVVPMAHADQSAIVVHSGGLEALIVDQKDAGLRRALDLVERRLIELPREIPAGNFPSPVAQAIWQLIANPMTLRIDPFDAPNDQVPPLSLMLTARGNPQRGAESLLQFINTFLPAAGITFPDPDATGISTLDTPNGKFFLGSRDVDGSKRLVAAMNRLDDKPDPVGLMGLPEGVTPALALHVDGARLKPLLARIKAEASRNDREAGEAIDALLGLFGLEGEQPTSIDAAIGHAKDRALIRAVVRNAALHHRPADPSRRSLNTSLLKLVPADALVASAGVFDLNEWLHMARDIAKEQGRTEDPFKEANDALGFNIQTEFVDALGTTYAFYRSNPTGGGGLASLVGVFELAKPDVFAATHAKIRKLVEEKIGPEVNGYVRIRSWKQGDHELFSLNTPGIPIPIEVTWTIHANALIVGATPPAFLAALQIAEHPDAGILSNPNITHLIGGSNAPIAGLCYMDTPRLAAEGFGFANLAASALANAVRSPTSPIRDPGVVMPLFSDFMKDVRPVVVVSTWVDNDLVFNGEMDRSMLVNLAGAAGGMGGPMTLAIVPLAAGIALPALAKARASAEQLKSATQVRAIVQGAIIYSNDHKEQAPKSLQELVDLGILSPEILKRPDDGSFDGSPDYALRTDMNPFTTFDASCIVAIERAALVNSESHLNVGFADGHVEYLSVDEFWQRMAADVNKGASSNFDIEKYAPVVEPQEEQEQP